MCKCTPGNKRVTNGPDVGLIYERCISTVTPSVYPVSVQIPLEGGFFRIDGNQPILMSHHVIRKLTVVDVIDPDGPASVGSVKQPDYPPHLILGRKVVPDMLDGVRPANVCFGKSHFGSEFLIDRLDRNVFSRHDDYRSPFLGLEHKGHLSGPSITNLPVMIGSPDVYGVSGRVISRSISVNNLQMKGLAMYSDRYQPGEQAEIC